MDEALAEDRRFRDGEDGWVVNRFVCPASKLLELGPVEVPLSIVLDGEDESWARDRRVEAVETRGEPPRDVAYEVFVEVPVDAELRPLADAHVRAKVRCGGERVPPVGELARFIRGCRELGLSFKATAGLHHAVRTDGQHGFLNLLAAVIFGDEEQALAEQDPEAFALAPDSFAWRSRRAGVDEIARGRDFFVSFGSCSAQEPADDLRALGFLPA